jgi:hypothetical protein
LQANDAAITNVNLVYSTYTQAVTVETLQCILVAEAMFEEGFDFVPSESMETGNGSSIIINCYCRGADDC